MGSIHIGHIKAALKKQFAGKLDLSDVAKHLDQDAFFFTRSLSAFVISELGHVEDPSVAANSVVDGDTDNGIDAFYFDITDRICYVVQSKWSKDGKSTLELGDMLKFVRGLQDLLDGELDRFGKLRAKSAELDSVLGDSQATFVVVVAYTGEQELAAQVRLPLDEFIEQQNSATPTEPLISLRVLRQGDLHAIVSRQASGESIKLKIMLHEWGVIKEPYLAYYGQVDLPDIATWKEFVPSLYNRNLRGFKGSTDVNDSISRTARIAPEHFWYFNNGITILADRVLKLPLGGGNRDSGMFDCEGASVVNGAQTVGSIISTVHGGTNGFHRARVLVRLISLEDCPEGFGAEITRAANTQNRIEKKDFAALDPEQERLKRELLLECNKTYSYRTGDKTPSPDEGCTLDDAAVALACAQKDVGLCVLAKREVSKLYEDILQAPYKVLFNPSLSPLKLWRSVEVLRAVDDTLRAAQGELTRKDRLVAIHGNRFILHLVFQGVSGLEDPTVNFEKVLGGVKSVAQDILGRTIPATQKLFAGSYPANLFKNATKCSELAQAV